MCATSAADLTFEQRLVKALPLLRRLAKWMTGSREDDIVHDVVELALRKQHMFDGRNLDSWLTVLMRHTIINQQRRDKRRPNVQYDVAELRVAAPERDPTVRICFEEAMSKLTEPQREVLRLRYEHDMSGPEVCLFLRMSKFQYNGRYTRGRAMLQRRMTSET